MQNKILQEYLVWIDILGFEKLAEEVAAKLEIDERKVRADFLITLEGKIDELEKKGSVIGKTRIADDWLLVADSVDSAFVIIRTILDHNSGYKNFEKIPLEIAVGDGQFDKWAKFEGANLIAENSTIDFLKTNIITRYREWYKRTHSSPIKTTYVVLTASVHSKMGFFDREFCKKIEHDLADTAYYETQFPFFSADVASIVRRGKVFEFLRRIGKTPDSLYRRIDRLFVTPNEYNEILSSLEKNDVVFLVGDPEIGKTYCAIRFLWEYYCKGYNPICQSGEEYEEREEVRKKMCEAKIPKDSVVYFEDPFGKLVFEDRYSLRREIGSFLSSIKGSNSKIIITSREETFKEFKKEKLSLVDLGILTTEMRLMKPSYSEEGMKDILVFWANEYNCKWLQNETLKSSVVEKAIERLVTPLSMKIFASDSKCLNDFEDISKLISEKSKEVRLVFAEEISKMAKEKLLFLTLVYILAPVNPDIIKSLYLKQCMTFGLDSQKYSFEVMENHFNSKINRDLTGGDEHFKFTHSSYEEGIVASWSKDEIRNFFLKVLDSLICDENSRVRGSCGLCLIRNFEDLSSFGVETRNFINKVLHDKKPDARFDVAEGVQYYYAHLPSNIALEFLEVMSHDRNRSVRAAVIDTIRDNFRSIPAEEIFKFLSRGLEDKAAWVRLSAVGVVNANMDLEFLPEEIVLEALEVNEKLLEYKGWLISYFAALTYNVFKEKVKELKTRY